MKHPPYTGPEPTLGYLKDECGWVWVYCVLTCGHRVAIPLAPANPAPRQ
jgi:hypothetical protein